MTKTAEKRDDGRDVRNNVEDVFLAGLGAFSKASTRGAELFDELVEQGREFRDEAKSTSEDWFDDVQHAIDDAADKARTKASGLLDQVRGSAGLSQLESVFDNRVAKVLHRWRVPMGQDIDAINAKLDRILKMLEPQKKTAKKTTTRKKAAKPAGTA